MSALHAIILGGGSGTRFWPLSRRALPKQLLKLAGDQTLLEQTYARANELADRVVVVTTSPLATKTRQALPDAELWTEPSARNTAPALVFAMNRIRAADPEALVCVFPADHVIEKPNVLAKLIDQARAEAQDGKLVTFGVRPTRAATGFGYIEVGDDGRNVVRFTEKPDAKTAQAWVDGGNHLWNSGIFLWSVKGFFEQFPASDPTHATVEAAPIDSVLLENSDRVVVFEADMGWADLGSWAAIDKKECRALLSDKDHVIHAPGKIVAVAGLEDLVIVDTPDVLLVTTRERAEEVKELVAAAQTAGLEDSL